MVENINMNSVIILITFCLTCIVNEVSSLSCYQCDSKIHSDCIEDFDHSHRSSLTIKSTECDVDAAEFCVKTTGVWGGVVGTTRYCSSRHMGNQCQFITYPDHDRVYRACIYTCSSDHCNTAISTYTSFTLLVALLTTSIYLIVIVR